MSRRATRRAAHGGRRNRKNLMSRKARRGVFSYVARPATTLARGASNVAGKTVKYGMGAATRLAGHATGAAKNALHNVGYGVSNIVDSSANTLDRTVSSLFGKKGRRAERKSRKASRKERK